MRSFIFVALAGAASDVTVEQTSDISNLFGWGTKPTAPSAPTWNNTPTWNSTPSTPAEIPEIPVLDSTYPHTHPSNVPDHTHEDNIQKCKDDVAALTGAAEDLMQQVRDLMAILTTAQGSNTVLANWLVTQSPLVTQNAAGVAELNIRIDADESDISDLTAEGQSLTDRIEAADTPVRADNLESATVSLDGRISANEALIVSANNNFLPGVSGVVAALGSAVTSIN